MHPENPPYAIFPVSWKDPNFGGHPFSLTLKIPCKNPKKVKVISKRPGKPSWMSFFYSQKILSLDWSTLQHRLLPMDFWTQISQPQKENLWLLGKRTGVLEIGAHIIKRKVFLSLFRMGFIGAAHAWRGWQKKKTPLPKICHTYPRMMKLGNVIFDLKKIKEIYKSRDTLLESCIFPLESSKFCYNQK